MKRVYQRRKESDRPSKMVRAVEFEQSKEMEKSHADITKIFNKDDTKILTKEYVLNDVNAIEKKWNLRNVEPITVSNEAVNGSNISVVMKTSLFEVVKNNFLSVLVNDKHVEKAEVTRTAKAKASNGSNAEVEYMIDITFSKEDVKHDVVLTCYNTCNRLYVQKRGAQVRYNSLGG